MGARQRKRRVLCERPSLRRNYIKIKILIVYLLQRQNTIFRINNSLQVRLTT